MSCGNNSNQAKAYEDSANYYSDKLAAITDSGYTGNDSIDMQRKTDKVIYEAKRKYYIDKMNESK